MRLRISDSPSPTSMGCGKRCWLGSRRASFILYTLYFIEMLARIEVCLLYTLYFVLYRKRCWLGSRCASAASTPTCCSDHSQRLLSVGGSGRRRVHASCYSDYLLFSTAITPLAAATLFILVYFILYTLYFHASRGGHTGVR